MAETRATVISLSNLAQGAAVELFGHELKKVMDNIRDANTSPKGKRRITMTVEFLPYKDRNGAEAVISVVSKLQPVSSVNSTVFLQQTPEGVVAYSHDVRQAELPLEIEAPAATNLVTMVS